MLHVSSHPRLPPFLYWPPQFWQAVRSFREISLFRVPRLAMHIHIPSSGTLSYSIVYTCFWARNLTIYSVHSAQKDTVGLQIVTVVVRSACPGPDRSNNFHPHYVLLNNRAYKRNKPRPNIRIHSKIRDRVRRRIKDSSILRVSPSTPLPTQPPGALSHPAQALSINSTFILPLYSKQHLYHNIFLQERQYGFCLARRKLFRLFGG